MEVVHGHPAVYRTAEVTKALIVAYDGRAPEHSCFIGCSNGWREALMEAQRYPADFDGIVAIAPWSTLSSGLRRSSATCRRRTQQATSAHPL